MMCTNCLKMQKNLYTTKEYNNNNNNNNTTTCRYSRMPKLCVCVYLEVSGDVGSGQDTGGSREEDGKDGEEALLSSVKPPEVGQKIPRKCLSYNNTEQRDRHVSMFF